MKKFKPIIFSGNEKDEDQADTVGCCSLRYEHVTLHDDLNGKENVVVFDFLGKDSIRYYNEVSVEKRVFKNLQLFKENKKEGDDLFDRLNTTMLNEHLKELMDGENDDRLMHHRETKFLIVFQASPQKCSVPITPHLLYKISWMS